MCLEIPLWHQEPTRPSQQMQEVKVWGWGVCVGLGTPRQCCLLSATHSMFMCITMPREEYPAMAKLSR